MAKKKSRPLENEDDGGAEEEEPDFSDPEDFVDDITDEELLGDLLRQKPKETDGVESVIIVDGVPCVGAERLEKLKNVVRKIFKEFGTIINEFYPTGEDGKTKGYIFLEFKDRSSADEAVRQRNNYKLDKQHTFQCNLFTDFDKYDNIPEEFVPPPAQPYKDLGNMHYYLLDDNCFDQYSIILDGGTTTAIYLNAVPEPVEIAKRERWTETYVRWSPRGTYLATFHGKGIALWGGEEFRQVSKFSHPGVQFIDFSPCEKYIVTFSPVVDQRAEEPQSIIIWDVRSGLKKRAFNAERPPVWPVFKWSNDDKYFARIVEDALSVYETPSFGLLDKKSIKVPGIKEFGWSPTDNILAYWIAEDKDVPAKVSLVSIPSREEIRTKNLFNVADCKMVWQKCGDYLCVKVARYAKAKRERNDIKYSGIYYNFEIFHMREKGIPVDSLEIKENIQAFAWEPVNNKFGIITGEPPSVNVLFFQVNKGQAPSELKRLEKRPCNNLFWSPQGQFVVLAGLRNMSGALEFVDTKDFQIMMSTEHFMATDIEWDPTGRYVASCVSWWGHKVDNAYWLWSFQGKCLKRHSVEKFCQLLWRPRPPSLLQSTDIKEIRKNMKKYAASFEVQDKMRFSKASREIIEKRQKQMSVFTEYRKKMIEQFESDKEQRLRLRGGECQDTDTLTSNENDFEEEIVEFLIKKEVIPVDD
ncbi:eukaryotic translation initiation factor 3 subunit B-like isoform X1 [Penaeus indicus]|uniref:eukaryotic translation initiation factor 3 subunit B-like isoform X1 n=1 Tax=Penaeus indicus TaxID=29960 RepID=UPI00300C2FA5